MIRLNDISKTVIDESKVIAYDMFADNFYDSKKGTSENKEVISLFVERHYVKAYYETKEVRDKDIELLDKIFDVKSIEDKAYAYPHEIDALKFAMSGIKEECKLVSGGEYDPVKKEEYLTWNYVKQFECGVNAYLPEGSIYKVYYEEENNRIQLGNECGYIYEEDLFNALMLKKVE